MRFSCPIPTKRSGLELDKYLSVFIIVLKSPSGNEFKYLENNIHCRRKDLAKKLAKKNKTKKAKK